MQRPLLGTFLLMTTGLAAGSIYVNFGAALLVGGVGFSVGWAVLTFRDVDPDRRLFPGIDNRQAARILLSGAAVFLLLGIAVILAF